MTEIESASAGVQLPRLPAVRRGVAGLLMLLGIALVAGPITCSDSLAYGTTSWTPGEITVYGDAHPNDYTISESVVVNGDDVTPDLSWNQLYDQAPAIGIAFVRATEQLDQIIIESIETLADPEPELQLASKSKLAFSSFMFFVALVLTPNNRQVDMTRVIDIVDNNGLPILAYPPCTQARVPGTNIRKPYHVQCAAVAGGLQDLTVYGRQGDDTIKLDLRTPGWHSKHTVSGGPGRDALYGSSLPDILIGGAQIDTIYGYGDVDWIQTSGDGVRDIVDCGLPDRTANNPFKGDQIDLDFTEANTVAGCEDVAWPPLPEQGG